MKMDDNSFYVSIWSVILAIALVAGSIGGSCYITEQAKEVTCNCQCDVLTPEVPQ